MVKSRQRHKPQFIPLPETLKEFVCMLSAKENKKILEKTYSPGSSCRRVLSSSIDCTPDASTMMQAVMCRTWYKMPPSGQSVKREMLVDTFRRYIKESWAQYKVACPRIKKKKGKK